MADLQIQYVLATDLVPYENNSRTHSQQQVDQIKRSMTEFGFTNPILVDEHNGIIAGHGRLQAAQELGIKLVPTITLKGLTEAQRKAYVIADNQLALNAGWDLDTLKSELLTLKNVDYDLTLMGFDNDFLNGILQDVEEGKTDEDAVPEAPETPVTVLGDIWVLGNHRLMCGDSTSIDAVHRLMDGQKADMVFTDPPYGVSYQSNGRKEKFDVLMNDDKLLDIVPVIESVSSGWVFVWTSWKVVDKWIDLFDGFGYPSNMIIWHKPGGGIGDLKKTFSSNYEIALVWHRGAELTGKRIGSVWTINKDGATTYIHPTQKPVALAEEALDKTTKIKAKVLDLFGGSGSTLIACEKTGRNNYSMELDPKYCDVIITRWQEFTGKQAVHETGKSFAEIAMER
jgi:DNA modification methylase